MSRRRLAPAQALLAALLVVTAALLIAELGAGAASGVPPKLGDPCRPRQAQTDGLDATIQRIVLDGLDGAACRLHTTREELVLSLGGAAGHHRRWDAHTIEVALRAGLLRAVDDAERRGDLPSFAAAVVRRLVRAAPLERLIQGGVSLRGLLG